MQTETLRAVGVLKTAPLEDGDVAAADRHARAIVNMARAMKAVDGMVDKPAADAAEPEDGMSEDHRDEDPAERERLSAEHERRLAELHTVIEAKRVEGWTFVPPAGDRHSDDGSAEASGDPGGGLADLGPSGWPGIGQDVRRGTLDQRAGA
ncbi:hypothetical protein [Brevundimonas sp.]|uniref:hypothetical protein n=1 Tax=Brevundimonas sp. TaxID=1871086 RepID=UPI002AC95599|nr:hypothetical protein [Brevundimonas sp.]